MSSNVAVDWVELTGRAREIAVGGDRSLWCLGMGEISPGGYSIHRWNGSDWDHVPGAARKISVASDG